jgi:hypothetical protein
MKVVIRLPELVHLGGSGVGEGQASPQVRSVWRLGPKFIFILDKRQVLAPAHGPLHCTPVLPPPSTILFITMRQNQALPVWFPALITKGRCCLARNNEKTRGND